MPLDVGIDHVIMSFRWGMVSSASVDGVLALAARHGLVVYAPQSDGVQRPDGQS
jgi:hypothetical protein